MSRSGRLSGLLAVAVVAAVASKASAADVDKQAKARADREAAKLYPPAAKDAHVEGMVGLACGRNEHNALRNCVVRWERPKGYGFGEAALALAARSPDNPDVTLAATDEGESEQVLFCLRPVSIISNVLLPRHAIVPARLTQTPSKEDILAAAPTEEKARGMFGWVTLHCPVGADGAVGPCQARDEAPLGYGFGEAALSLGSKIKATPKTVDGAPQGDGWVEEPIQFGPLPRPPPPPPAPPAGPEYLCRR
jgi:hypothetical protein